MASPAGKSSAASGRFVSNHDLQLWEAIVEILRPVGQGGAGAVYLVRDRETGAQLAMTRTEIPAFARAANASANSRPVSSA